MNPNRRAALQASGSGLVACGLSLATGELTASDDVARPAGPRAGGGLPPQWRAMHKYDAHNHVGESRHRLDGYWAKVESTIAAAESLGIEKQCCSRPTAGCKLADIGEVHAVNDAVLAAMKRFSQQISRLDFIQPDNGQAALGVETIAFGSHLPLDDVGPSLVNLANLESMPKDDCEKIAWRHAATFLQFGT